MTNHWLLKTEPDDYSYEDLENDGETVWDGVGNNLALVHMREVVEGDLAMIYHTGRERRIVGVARITSDNYPDPEHDNPKRVVFDLEPLFRLEDPVELSAIKEDGGFDDWDLVTNPRLSVMPVTQKHWEEVLAMAGVGEDLA